VQRRDDEIPDRDENPEVGEVPAGGAGADSGAADAVRVDEDDEASIANVGSQNDIPGVGTRPPSRS
jgi:hypothetical protein